MNAFGLASLSAVPSSEPFASRRDVRDGKHIYEMKGLFSFAAAPALRHVEVVLRSKENLVQQKKMYTVARTNTRERERESRCH